MTGLYQTPGESPMTAVAKWRQREARRKLYLRRRLIAGLLLLSLLTGLYFGLDWLLTGLFGGEQKQPGASTGSAPAAVETTPLSFKPERFLDVGDLDGDGTPERIAVGPVQSFLVEVALVTGPEKSLRQLGSARQVANFPLAVVDLPRAKRVLVRAGSLPLEGEKREVKVGGQPAVEAAGEEPDYLAWTLDMQKGLVEADYYQLAAPLTPKEPTMILVDKWLNVLWYYEEGRLVQTSRVATGIQIEGPAPSATNQMQNKLTPTGRFTIANKQANPPFYKDGIAGGDPANPLGTRFMGFSVYPGDQGHLWAIHGTAASEEARIGRWVSNGPIQMKRAELEALFDRVKVGTVLEIIGKP